MTDLIVDTAARRLLLGTRDTPCMIGKRGACAAPDKREGDGCTPLGTWPLRSVLLRPGWLPPDVRPALPWRWIRADDGWCDDPADTVCYNRPVRLPHGYGAERLWRSDGAYDAVIVLGHNDAPPVPGAGSAIFFHLWVTDAQNQPGPTEGCVAIAREVMVALLPHLHPGMAMRIA